MCKFEQKLLLMERRMTGNCHVRCGTGENSEITSKSYLSSSYEMIAIAMEGKRLGLHNKWDLVLLCTYRTKSHFIQLSKLSF